MTTEEIKSEIKDSLKAFASGNFTANALKFFQTLDYVTERQSPLLNPTFKEFQETYIDGKKFDKTKAKASEWKYVDLLFQLSKEEVLKQTSLFDTKKVDSTVIETYLFFAIELSKEQYSRTELSLITREVNRLFPMPAMILFKHGNTLTLSVINRRLHKKDESKDVLEKVTQIKDINIAEPHRAHIEIMFDLSFNELKTKHQFTNFVELHNAWQLTLDTKELNKKFFNELANWYFWATQKVVFPDYAEKDKDLRNATGVIRLITRLMFVWFLKEKNLVPDDLFEEKKLKPLLKYSDKNKSTYYKAILQNLFFATLNTEMGNRRFRIKSKDEKQRDGHHFIHNVFRYEDEFVKPKETLEKYFANIPFLNGGLFECLDAEIEKPNNQKDKIRIDGFSDRDDNVLKVPDEIFFSAKEKIIDLSEVYGTPKKSKEKVRGLFDILSSYKFTIAENTPIEEEVALDPELLGKVFENLLANYNPETQTTARKQTGSFYTPREIVNYMVDESLIAYLKQQLNDNEKTETKLRDLLSYSESEVQFSITEKEKLIHAIDTIKIIDPACGSGAFPMGILHKLVHTLHKLDPKNELWKQRQLDKAHSIDDAPSREAATETIEEAFENNELDYGRKLYLIENCIYGVDIQPIAVQISKLRFFISLIVEQRTNPKKENLGVRPLPNLETKFVAANTLIELEKENANLFTNPEIDKKKEQLKKIRHEYFEARTPKRKENCRIKDKQLRDELADLLINNHDLQPATAKKVAAWNPYDQNASATFFDMEWMFGLKDGFDVVIGNPPYVFSRETLSVEEKATYKALYSLIQFKINLYILFIERGYKLLREKSGCLFFITPNNWLTLNTNSDLRKFLLSDTGDIHVLQNYANVFESASVDTVIVGFKKTGNSTLTYLEWV
ncbi:MAG: Eco57I restriction-modification methylase domain-containing protein, partial [Bacteroidota bacterium]